MMELPSDRMELPSDRVDGTVAADDILLVLGPRKAHQLQAFQKQISFYDSEAKKYSLCCSKRDELLEEKNRIQIEFVYYEQAFAKSTRYRAAKKTDTEWQNFMTTVAEGLKGKHRMEIDLQSVVCVWGSGLVQDHLLERGPSFALRLAAAAKRHPDWTTAALPRLQQLVNRRIQLEGRGRHAFMYPLERTDLINLKTWTANGPYIKQNDPENLALPFENLCAKQLPHGYRFDQYRLIVRDESAVRGSANGYGLEEQNLETGPVHSSEGCDREPADRSNRNDNECTDTASGANSDAAEDTPETDRTTPASDASASARASTCVGKVLVAPAEASEDPPDGQDANYGATTGLVEHGAAPSKTALRRSPRERVNGIARYSGRETTNESSLLLAGDGKTRGGLRGPARGTRKMIPPPGQRQLDMTRLRTLVQKLPVAAAGLPTASHPTVSSLGMSMGTPEVSSKRQRAASLPPDLPQCPVAKRHQIARPGVGPEVGLVPSHDYNARPQCDWESDEAYLAQAIDQVRQEASKESTSRGTRTAERLLPILQSCQHPVVDGPNGAPEVHLLNGYEAKTLLENTTSEVPVITERQQHFQWKDPGRPIPEFFERMEDLDRMVSVQIPSLEAGACSHERHSIGEVRERFLSAGPSEDPWNILDCSCPLPSTLPDFLTGRNCQLLARMRDNVLNGASAERVVASPEAWAEWRDIEHWALLSEGGHCTAAHMDSHGLATWITVQEGRFGFAWMSRPTEAQRAAWMGDVEHYDGGQPWRYWVLKAGQTIFFPSGTIHSVFRVRQGQTLGLGGHILQWSGLDGWMDVLSQQVEAPDSTNEDMADAWRWIPVMEELMQKKLERLAVEHQTS